MAVPTTVNATSVAAMIKELFPQKRIDRMWEQQFPLLSEIKKSDRGDGSSIRIPVETDHPAVSGDFTKAQANYFATSSQVFDVTLVDLYGVARIVSKTMRQARSDVGSFVRVLDREIENLLKAMRKRAAYALYRDQGGSIGTLSAVASAPTFTMTNKSDTAALSVGANLVFSAASTGTSLRNSGTAVEVTAVDYTNGTFTLASDPTLTIGDYVFVEGDASNDYTGGPAGLADWVTASTPGALFGVTRTGFPERLSGHKITDTSLSIAEAIQEAAYRIAAFGSGMPDRCYMNTLQMKNLAQELDTQVVRDPGGTGKAGFSGFVMQTAQSNVTVIGDPACPENRAYCGQLSDLELIHLDPFPHLVMDDSLRMLRVSNADQVEVRARGWYNLVNHAPGHWASISLTSAS